MALKWHTELKKESEKFVGSISMTLSVVVEKDNEENRYYALTPDLPGCATIGATPQEALENMWLTIQEWLMKE